jgi:hypothetical protein
MLYTIRFVIFIIALFNLGEFFSGLPEQSINIYVIIITIILYIISLFFPSLSSSHEELLIDKFLVRRLFVIILISNTFLIYFVFKNIDDYSLLGLAIFMEKYRNGFYQGSGIFTFLSTNIVPLLLSYFIYFFRINKRTITVLIIFSIIPLLSLGLRVFVIPIIFSLLFKHFDRNKIFSSQSVLLFLLLISLTISTKLLLISDSTSNSFGETVIKVLTRTNYQAIIVPNGVNGGYTPLLLGKIDDFKDLFYKQNYEYIDRLYLSDISKSSGLAIPLLPLNIILFGYFFGFIFISIIFIFIFYNVSKLKAIKSSIFSFKRLAHFYIIIFLLAGFIEDFSFLYKILYIPFLWVILLIVNNFHLRKLLNSFQKIEAF